MNSLDNEMEDGRCLSEIREKRCDIRCLINELYFKMGWDIFDETKAEIDGLLGDLKNLDIKTEGRYAGFVRQIIEETQEEIDLFLKEKDSPPSTASLFELNDEEEDEMCSNHDCSEDDDEEGGITEWVKDHWYCMRYCWESVDERAEPREARRKNLEEMEFLQSEVDRVIGSCPSSLTRRYEWHKLQCEKYSREFYSQDESSTCSGTNSSEVSHTTLSRANVETSLEDEILSSISELFSRAGGH